MTQHLLFDDDLPPWELDDQSEHLVATVVFVTGAAREFDYLVPESLANAVLPGRRVKVPFGRSDRLLEAYCVQVERRAISPERFKSVHEVVDQRTLLGPSILRLTRWMADYYLCDWGQVLEAVVPAGVRGSAGTRLTTFLQVPTRVAARLSQLELPPKQLEALRVLALSPQPLTVQQLAHQARCGQGPITTLRRKGLVEATTRRVSAHEFEMPSHTGPAEVPHELNVDQQHALDMVIGSLRSGVHETILLHGITGSGKTEVYMRAIAEVLGYGRQAIVLVPEISLTPQTCERFRARFGRVAVLHSHLSDAERHWHWQQIAAGDVPVVVGARSAIFAPVPRLGLIVLDEEHESTFKQETAPRYHAREVAIRRASDENVPLVLGSATPSLESWHRAQTGQYRLVSMPRRVMNLPLPDVLTVDLRSEQSKKFGGAISRQLYLAMQQALGEGGQVILLLNRRGFSTHIQCPDCGEAVRCPRCDISLTHHRQENRVVCHYCNYETSAPKTCPQCNSPSIRYGGLGTQRLEAEVRARFPQSPCLRMDADAMQSPGAHEKALAAFRNREFAILLGTQMIAKGLDFPNVTLVGVINADVGLHLPDFRAAERTFQLLVQVAGRTGRGSRGGRVLVQTFSPDHAAIQAAVRHDYDTFARQELPIRESHAYPPYASMVRVVVRGVAEEVVASFAETIAERIRAATEADHVKARILGPATAPVAKIRGRYRFQLQVQSGTGETLREAVRRATASLKAPEGVQWIVDIDPLDML